MEPTLLEMRRVLGQSNGLQELKDDVKRLVLTYVDRPLTLRRISKGMRESVHLLKLPLGYVLDLAKFEASTSTDKIGDVLGDLGLKCHEFDVVSISMRGLGRRFTDATGLAALLPLCARLASLDLSQNCIRIATLDAGLATCTALTSLDLSMGFDTMACVHNFGAEGTRRLCDALNCPDLSVLRLCSCGIHDRPGESGALRFLAAALLKCPQLTHVDVAHNHFDSANFAALVAPALPALAVLAVLDLSYTKIEAAGLTALGRVLPLCPALAELNVGGCVTTGAVPTGAGTWAFASGLARCPALAKLNVMYNEFGALVADIVRALPRCRRLTDLNLAHTKLSLDQQVIFMDVLPQCERLSRLNLVGHEFGMTDEMTVRPPDSPGLVQLPAVLARCALTELTVRDIDLDQATRRRLEAGWRSLSVFQTWVRRVDI